MTDEFLNYIQKLEERINVLESKVKEKSRLSEPAIFRNLNQGNIIIDPFNPKNLGSSQYDVTLGYHYWRKRPITETGITIFNPYDENQVKNMWKHETAIPVSKYLQDRNINSSIKDYFGENIFPHNKIIILAPLEMILAHTQEYVGGTRAITTDMAARSSWGRNSLEVCRCAGTGDIGFFNRWTMEITNTDDKRHVVLVEGRRIAQIKFYETEPLASEKKEYNIEGKYQSTSNIEKIKSEWNPEHMLPKLWKDREVDEDKKLHNH